MTAQTMLDRLLQATNSHDADAVAECFTVDYVNDTPAHPARGFRGREQVRRNWEQIFAAVPDLRADLLRRADNGDESWSEWEMTGTRADGSPHCMRGVIIFGVAGATAASARFYLEPVDAVADGIDAAVAAQVIR